MDISYRVGLSTGPSLSHDEAYSVVLNGLTSNPEHGATAQRETTITAVVVFDGAPPSSPVISYQWHTMSGGAIPGATGQTLFIDAAVPDLGTIYCSVSIESLGNRDSSTAIVRHVPPTLVAQIFDEIYDQNSGTQVVDAAAAFTGSDLTYALNGAVGTIDVATGFVSIATDALVSGTTLTVSATNSGGTITEEFIVTVEAAMPEGTIPFGSLTPPGYGGIPVSGTAIVAGDPTNAWTVGGGMLSPSGGAALQGNYSLSFDNGATIEIGIEPDKASARPEELVALMDQMPASCVGILVQDGDARSLGRLRLPPKAFQQECVIEPTNWIEDTDPRQSYRPVIFAALTIGGDPSGDRILRMENLTVQGFVVNATTADLGEPETGNGLVLIERPSRFVTIRQNEIWSRDHEEIILSDDWRDGNSTSQQMRGIATKVYSGTNERIWIEDNHIHDVSRGAVLTATNSYQGQRSRFCRNIIEHCYTNFTTAGFCDGLDMFDNKCMGVYAANEDSLSGNPPHSAAGGSFDASTFRSTENVSFIGNLLHIGWSRTKICADNGLPKPSIGATGLKMNDPTEFGAYYNIVIAFNTIVSHGICLAMDGVSADDRNLVFNNTLADESYAGAGSEPIIYMLGWDKVDMFDNIAPGISKGSADNTGFYPDSWANLRGHRNIRAGDASGDFSSEKYFVGDPQKALTRLSIDEAMTAYIPKPGTLAQSFTQMPGAQGTGRYLGDGIHTVSYQTPTPFSAASSPDLEQTYWNGSAYLIRSSAMDNVSDKRDGFTLAFAGAFDPAANRTMDLFGMVADRFRFIIGSGRRAVVYTTHSSAGIALDAAAKTLRLVRDLDQMQNMVFAYNADQGYVQFALNGQVEHFFDYLRPPESISTNILGAPVTVGARESGGNTFQGRFGRAWGAAEFVDIESDEGISKFYADDGGFKDFGADGSLVTGVQPAFYFYGNAANVATNRGNCGAFSLSGSVTDV